VPARLVLGYFCCCLLCCSQVQVQGSGFLYKQVRHMTGALLALGEGRIALQDIAARLEVGNNQPPGGLCFLLSCGELCLVAFSRMSAGWWVGRTAPQTLLRA
jgi:hypothetical protein